MIDIRNETESRVLQSLASIGPQSKAELARDLGVMRSTVGARIARLLDLGIVRPAPEARVDSDEDKPRFGRPGALLELTPEFCSFACVDVSFGIVRAALFDLQCNTVATRSARMTPHDQSPDATSGVVIKLLEDVMQGREASVEGIIVGVPGVVDDQEMILRAPCLGWQDVDLKSRLQDRFRDICHITIANDASLFASAQSQGAPWMSFQNAVLVWLDTGVGGALVANGALVFGRSGLAGELGHMIVSSQSAGKVRRLEDIAGVWALLSRNQELGGTAETLADLIAEHDAGAPSAAEAFREWATAMAEGMATLTSVFDPEAMIFVGPATALLQRIETQTFEIYLDSLLHGTTPADWHIVPFDDQMLLKSGATLLRAALLQDVGPDPDGLTDAPLVRTAIAHT